MQPLLRRRATPNVHRGVTSSRERATRAYEGARETVRALPRTRADAREIVFVRGTTEAINLVATSYARARARRRRRGPDHRAGAPLEHRALADALRASAARSCASSPIDDRGELRLDELERAARPAHEAASRSPTSRTRSAPSTRSREIVDARARARRAGAASTARRRCRTCRSTCRRSAATSTPSRATRCTARPGIGVLYGRARAARGDAALPGRRRHDPLGHASRRPPTTASPHKFEAGTPDIAGGDRARRGDRLRAARSASTRIAAHEQRAARATRPSARARCPALRLIGTAREKAARALVRARRRPPARRRHDPRPARASRSAPATTARSR